MTLYRIKKSIICSDTNNCINTILTKLENSSGLKLHADNENDMVDGYIYVQHKQGNHLIIVCIYNQGKHEYVDGEELKEFSKTGKIKEMREKEHKDIVFNRARKINTVPSKTELEQAIDRV